MRRKQRKWPQARIAHITLDSPQNLLERRVDVMTGRGPDGRVRGNGTQSPPLPHLVRYWRRLQIVGHGAGDVVLFGALNEEVIVQHSSNGQ